MPTVKIFDATLQEEVDHKLTMNDLTGEILAESESGHTIKFAAGLTQKQFAKVIADHKEANEGQEVISVAEQEDMAKQIEKSRSLLDSFSNDEE